MYGDLTSPLSLLTTFKLCNHQSTNTLNLRAWYLPCCLLGILTHKHACTGDFGIIHFAILQFAQLPVGDDH